MNNTTQQQTVALALAPHCLIVPFPFQGHINPLLQFAKRLITHHNKNLQITFALTKFFLTNLSSGAGESSISLRSISDGFDAGGRAQANSGAEYLSKFAEIGSQTLTELIQDLSESGRPVDCVIYDPFIPWALDVAKGKFGISTAAFFTQSCAVDNIYSRVYNGDLELPLPENEVVRVPGLPEMEPFEMPSFVYLNGSYPSSFEMVVGQFRNVDEADWVFVNTFYELEKEVIDWMSKFWRVKAIGPTIPSMFMDKRLQEDKSYGLSMFKHTTNDCINWLNEKQSKSVIYVAFGSLAELSQDQTQELAHALTTYDKHFLWVVRSSEEAKLPENFGNETSKKGLIVSWCPQLEVLSHEAIACFVTHCGWNSTLEGLSLGVPMVAMPQWTDQSTNAKFIVDVWGVGVRAKVDEGGLARQDEIVRCLESVMEGENGEKIRKNANEWKERACNAVDEGGSSDKNIEEFVTTLISSHDLRQE